MSDSLKDQLLALGLAKSRPTQKKRKKPRPKRANSSAPAPASNKKGDISLDAAYSMRKKEEKASVEQAKAEKRALDLERRRLNKQLASLIEGKTLNDPKAEIKRNFVYKGRIRSVLVTAEQLKALNNNELFLVFLRGSYFIIEAELKQTIATLSDEHIPDLSGGEVDEGDHPVPDDLIW